MDPTQKDIADLFSVVVNKDPSVEQPSRKTKGGSAEESQELGAQCLTDGDYEKAIEHFRRAIEQRPSSDPSGHIDLAGAYEFAEMAPEALRQYEKALRISKDTPEPILGVSQLYKRNARYKDSLKHLEDALVLEPHNAFLRFKMAEVLREIGEFGAALESARMAVAAAPSDSFYHYWVGDLLISMRRFDEALEALRAALELSPGDDYLYLRAAVAFWGAGKQPEALKSVRLASDLDPDKNLYHGVLERMLRASGQVDEADLEAKRSSKMDDYDRDALARLTKEIDL